MAEKPAEFYDLLFQIENVPELALKALKSPSTNADAIDFIQRAAPKAEDPWAWAPNFMSEIFRTIALNTAIPDERLPAMIEAFRAVVPKARAYLDSPASEPSIDEDLSEKFFRTVNEFSKRSVSEERQAAFHQCIGIVNETFGARKGVNLSLAEPKKPKLFLVEPPPRPEPGEK